MSGRMRLALWLAWAGLAVGAAHAQGPPITPGQTHFAPGVYAVTQDLTFDAPVTCDAGAVLDVAAGVTVTFRAGLTAGAGQVFSGAGHVRGLTRLTPEMFGARGDGATDDTIPFQQALASFTDDGFWTPAYRGHNVLVLRGAYRLSSVSVDVSGLNLQCENARLVAMETGAHPYLIRFTRQFCSITGYLTIEGNYNMGYECMVHVNNRHFSAHNVNIWRAVLGWRFGSLEWGVTSDAPGMSEKGDSEIEIIGGATVYCLRGIEAIGSNTIVTFSGALIYSYPWTLPEGDPRKAAWESADATIIRCYGALVYYTGGQLCNTSSRTPVVEVQPVRNTQPEYFSHYGGVYIANCHIEAGYLFRAVNPRQIRQQDSTGKVLAPDKNVALWLIGCGGWVRDQRVAVEGDPLFTGTLIFANNNFCGPQFDTFARLENPTATIVADDVTLRNKWRGGLSAIVGGAPLFSQRTVLEARLKQNRTLGPQATAIPFDDCITTDDTGHFRGCYDAARGVFTVPPGGLDDVTVTAYVTFAKAMPPGAVRLSVRRNGEGVFATTNGGVSGTVSFKFSQLAAGDTLAVAGAKCTLRPGEGTVLRVEASRH